MIALRFRSVARRTSLLVAAVVGLGALAGGAPALAAGPAPYWKLESTAAPTKLPLQAKGVPGEGIIDVTAANLGDASVDVTEPANRVTITDTLPAGVEATSVVPESHGNIKSLGRNVQRPNNTEGLRCSKAPVNPIVCTFESTLPPFEELEIFIRVKVKTETPSEPANVVTVEGGGAKAPEPLAAPLDLSGASGEATRFGVEQFEMKAENEDGSLDGQAGSHPYQLTTVFDLNKDLVVSPEKGAILPSVPAMQKNLSFQLPPGLLGDANAVPQCSGVAFGSLDENETNSCPADTAVGVATVTIYDPITINFDKFTVPVFNLAPAPGEPARFGLMAAHVPVILNTSVRTGGDYGATVTVEDSSEAAAVLGSRVTFWGVPGDAAHNSARGWDCLEYVTAPVHHTCEENLETPNPPAFLSLPTSCAGQPTTTVTGTSWPAENGEVARINAGDENTSYKLPQLASCNLLGFSPTMTVETDTEDANTPTALKVNVKLPQESTLEAGGLAEAAVRDTAVTLPEGVLLSPSAGNGLEACAEGETEAPGGVGFTGNEELEPGSKTATFTEKLPNPLEPGVNFCPNASKVGIVHIKSPDLANELEGGVYLATQNTNPFGSLFAMYIVAQDPVSKVLVKLAGEVNVSPTGRIVSTFNNTPQDPFEELRLELFGGPRASLTTPPACGTYATKGEFTPWSGSSAEPGTVTPPSPTFKITAGPGGEGCSPTPAPFKPSFVAGSTNSQAGAFSSFGLSIGLPQADGALKTISNMKLPQGLAAVLGSVPLCEEPQAAEGTCGEESLIGHSTASSGLGSDPYNLPGKVYLTGPYNGAPFGLSAVTLADTGPGCPSRCTFHLGRVVVRSSISVDPVTAAATISTEKARFINEKGEAEELSGLPEFIDGVPSQIKQLNVTVDRPNFQFNPTNCTPTSITATLTGAGGASEPVSTPFKASNCASLPFEPKISATVKGQGSKVNGVSFAVTIESPGLGQANIHRVDLTLPKALPSRLDTIQKACKVQIFEVNPASCDEGSVIGEGIVHTPVFKNPLRGPAYLVGHAGEEFPDVEFVLQGEGVTIILDGKTFIQNGVTFSKFETAPDAPFTKFESLFPEGPHSALTVESIISPTRNLCKVPLSIPTEIGGQNGALITETTPVKVLECGGVINNKTKKLTRAQLLAKALKACKKHKQKSKRHACEKQARKKYAPKHAKKKTKK